MNSNRAATIAQAAPFAAFIALMGVERAVSLPEQVFYPIRLAVVVLLLAILSRPYLRFRPTFPVTSIALGTIVFLIWIGPDVLIGYRHFWLFENALTGHANSAIDPALRRSVPFIVVRVIGCALVVPVFEELFWRSWLMRWLVKPDFLAIPFGFYTASAFWTVAALFAAEHGPYWEVGLAAGILYNWWAVRTRNLADCIVAHAVTNALLSVYVLLSGRWEYWL
ncbi:MAG TPA: CAAX prenyl protease-related protein [Bryobacteraceae bacterium]|nr:CAAX prenyl protease-related protein [Bryobacteraceae bacterium]